MSNADIKSKCEQLAGFYCGDVDPTDLYGECLQFVYYLEDEVKERQKKKSSPNIEGRKKTLFETLYSRIKSNSLESSFPNIEIALRIFLSMMVTNCKGERSFSKLKRIKNESRASTSASTTEDRLNNLTLMSIESDLLNHIDVNDIISDFASRKSRSVPI
jgi:hypothetical protein